MNGNKLKGVFILIISFIFYGSQAQYKEAIYKCYISNKMDTWKEIIDKMQSEKQNNNKFLLELVNYQYGYIGWCIENKNEKEAEFYLKHAENNIANIEKSKHSASMTNAYKSAFYGFRIVLAPWRGPFLGNKSISCAKKAMELEPDNPYGYIEYGNIQYYMPAMFGGSKTEAIAYYLKALDLMKDNPTHSNMNWNFIRLLFTIARAYEEAQNFNKAKLYYQLTLKAEPDFLIVKNSYYPGLLNKIKNQP